MARIKCKSATVALGDDTLMFSERWSDAEGSSIYLDGDTLHAYNKTEHLIYKNCPMQVVIDNTEGSVNNVDGE